MLMKPISQPDAHVSGSRFLRSVHLETDLRDADSLQGYLVTSGTRSVLPRLGLARQTSSANRAFTITGPYGTGKSAQSLYSARVLAPPEFPGAAAAQRLLQEADPETAAAVLGTNGHAASLLPVAITGSREPLAGAILRGVAGALEWLKGHRRAPVVAMLNSLREKSHAARGPNVNEMLGLFGKLLDTACDGSGPFGGMFLIIDELGKLLEHAAGGHGGSDVYLLQALAEFAARTPQPFVVLGVLHRDFVAYTDRLSARDRAEWEKVGGRFENITFVQPADDALRLIALARTQARSLHGEKPVEALPPAVKRTLAGLCEDAWKLGMAPAGMSKSEFVGLLRDSWPHHRLVTLLLGRLFQKLAQNERSVFAFLESGEPFGLPEFIADNGRDSRCVYGPDRIYDYLVASVGEGLYSHWQGKRWAEIDTVLTRLADRSPLDVGLAKTIGLLGVMGEGQSLQASAEVLQFARAPTASAAEVGTALKELKKQQSSVVFRRHSDSYALWEGSDIDLDAAVRAARGRIGAKESLTQRLSRHAAVRPLVARRHSFQRGCLRRFAVKFASVSAVQQELATRSDADDAVTGSLCYFDVHFAATTSTSAYNQPSRR
jgi:hypothetical protein